MIKNYLLSSIRALVRHKTFTLLNIFGLSIGIAAGMVILQYVQHELSYDQFHAHAQRLVRADHTFLKEGKPDFASARTFPRVGPAMLEDFPEVENYCRIVPLYRGGLLKSNETGFHEDHIWFADSSFLSMFSFPWIDGDKMASLREVNTGLLEESTARKYFGDESPIGKRMSIGSLTGTIDFEVRGVFRNPANSHIPMTVVLSYPTAVRLWGENAHSLWGWYDFHTYLLLKPGVEQATIDSNLPAFVDRHGGERLGSKRVQLSLRPLTDIHLGSDLIMEAGTNGSSRTVYFLFILGVAILMIAWTNYVNMATARAMERAKEVGVRKVSGSSRWQLGMQFMVEAGIVNLVSIVIGVAMIAAFIPVVNQLTGKSFDYTMLMELSFLTKLLILFGAGTILVGAYPAFVLSSFRPMAVLKGRIEHSAGGGLLRKSLVVAQFTASVILIAGTIIVAAQLRHLQSIDLGIDISNTLVIKVPVVVNEARAYTRALEAYRDDVMTEHNVSAATISSEIPGRKVTWYGGAKRVGIDQEAPSTTLYMTTIDANYFNVFGIDLIAGRTYSPGQPVDSTNVVVNARALKSLGFASLEEAVQGRVLVRGDTFNVIGIVEDYHHESPKDDYRPSIYFLSAEEQQFFSFKVHGDPSSVVSSSDDKFARMFPGEPFDYFFLNDFYASQYETEDKFLSVFVVFAVLAIVIAAVGLFGLSAYTISRRTREVGIRKVLGSTGWQIFLMFGKDFSIQVIAGNIVAIPVVWVVMNEWLTSFSERITIGVEVFVATTLITFVIAIATISYHAWRSANLNPAKALKTE